MLHPNGIRIHFECRYRAPPEGPLPCRAPLSHWSHGSQPPGLALALLLATAADARRRPTPLEARARNFAVQFIDDHLTASNAPSGDPLAAVRARLTPELGGALDEEDRAQQAQPDRLAGLDSDPIFCAPDTPKAVSVGPVHCVHGRCAVILYARFDRETRASLLSRLLLRRTARGFAVRDIHDTAGQGLLAALRRFQRDRAHDSPPGG